MKFSIETDKEFDEFFGHLLVGASQLLEKYAEAQSRPRHGPMLSVGSIPPEVAAAKERFRRTVEREREQARKVREFNDSFKRVLVRFSETLPKEEGKVIRDFLAKMDFAFRPTESPIPPIPPGDFDPLAGFGLKA